MNKILAWIGLCFFLLVVFGFLKTGSLISSTGYDYTYGYDLKSNDVERVDVSYSVSSGGYGWVEFYYKLGSGNEWTILPCGKVVNQAESVFCENGRYLNREVQFVRSGEYTNTLINPFVENNQFLLRVKINSKEGISGHKITSVVPVYSDSTFSQADVIIKQDSTSFPAFSSPLSWYQKFINWIKGVFGI